MQICADQRSRNVPIIIAEYACKTNDSKDRLGLGDRPEVRSITCRAFIVCDITSIDGNAPSDLILWQEPANSSCGVELLTLTHLLILNRVFHACY